MLWYDPARKRLAHVVVGSDGVVQRGIHTDDVTGWEATSDGAHASYKVRGSDTHAADGEQFTRRGQMSLDGKNWLPLFEAEFTKVAEISGATADDEPELIKLEEELGEAVVKRDRATMDRMVADDATIGIAEGFFVTEQQVLDYVQSGAFKLNSMTWEDLKVRTYGDMAVVTGALRWTDADGQRGRDVLTDIWHKRDGGWQIVATHESKGKKTVDTARLCDEMKKLAGFVGTWRYEGEQLDPPVAGLPYGGAGPFHGTNTQRFILGGRFLESTIEDNNPSGKTTVVTITGYDPKAGHYVANAFLSDGSRDSSTETVSPDGRTWTRQSTMTTSEGEAVPVRTVIVFSPDGTRMSSTTEVSPDHGTTWKHWFKDEAHKVND